MEKKTIGCKSKPWAFENKITKEENEKICNICHKQEVQIYWQPIVNADIELCDECADAILKDNPLAIERIKKEEII